MKRNAEKGKTMPEAATFGRTLKSLRGVRVVSQKELATRLEMDAAYLSRMENDVGGHLPCVGTIERIADALDLSQTESDQLYVLARKVPPDVLEIIVNNPRAMAQVRQYWQKQQEVKR